MKSLLYHFDMVFVKFSTTEFGLVYQGITRPHDTYKITKFGNPVPKNQATRHDSTLSDLKS